MLTSILLALLPLLFQRTVKSIITELWLENVVVMVLLRVIEESLSVNSSSLLHLTRVLELLSESKVVWLVPLMIDNAIARVVADNLVETSRDFLAISPMLMRSLSWVILGLHVTLQFLLSFQSSALEVVEHLVVIEILIRIYFVFRILFHLQISCLSRIESLLETLLASFIFDDNYLLLVELIGFIIIWQAFLDWLFWRCPWNVVSTMVPILLF